MQHQPRIRLPEETREFLQFDEYPEKIDLCQKKEIFGQTYTKFAVAKAM